MDRGRPPVLSEDEITWAYEKWCEGYTMQQIAEALYVDRRTIGNVLRGRPRKKPGVRPKLVYPGKRDA